MNIPHYLIEAYKGYHDDELPGCEGRMIALIQQDPPKRRLKIYLEWEGILGYTDIVFDLATTEKYDG